MVILPFNYSGQHLFCVRNKDDRNCMVKNCNYYFNVNTKSQKHVARRWLNRYSGVVMRVLEKYF